MNIKEVLEIVNEYIGRLNIGYEILLTEDQLTFFNIIKQDLEKLEKLEKENSYLQVQNKGLKDMVEIDKLKEALDILIRKLDIHLTKTENYDTAETYYSVYIDNACEILYPEEYELLKEVIGNETNSN